MGIGPGASVWAPGTGPLPPKAWSGKGRPPARLRRDEDHQPVTVKALALTLKESDWRLINWREGSGNPLKSRFARLRARPAHEDFRRNEPRPEEWLVIEWPEDEDEPTKFGSPRSTPAYPLKRLPISSNFAGASNATIKISNKSLALGTTKAGAGEAFIITQRFALWLTAS